MKNNIVLIGMPGVGKSTVGVILAKILGKGFVDGDLVIQEKQKMLLKNIIEDRGIDGFIEVENNILANLDCENCVIATGGSAIYGKEAMEHLSEQGIIVYLKLPYDEINRRLGDIKGRGVVLRRSQTLKDLYDERIPLYEQYADITVCEENLLIEETVEQVRSAVVEYENK